MHVREITPLDKRRCRVLMEEDFAFVLYRGEIKKYKIEEGEELSQTIYEEILHTILIKRARERLCYLLGASQKTEKELMDKLTSGGYPKEAVEAAIYFGKEYGYIDDRSYAVSYIECQKNRKSRRELLYRLQQKGIDKELLTDLLSQMPECEEAQVRAMLEKKKYHKETADKKECQKLVAYLGRKGFSFDVISKVMHQGSGEEFYL